MICPVNGFSCACDQDGWTPCQPFGQSPADTINPAHYKAGKVEVIDFIREQLGDEGFVAYCRGNAIKYHARAGKKGIAPSAEDLAKAGWYSQMAAHVGDPSKYPDPRVAK